MVVGVGRTLFHRLVQGLGSPREVFSASRSDMLRIQGIGDKIVSEIKRFDVDSAAERELRLANNIDNLIENSILSPAQVSATLLQLELRGLVRQLGGKMYISNCGDEHN